MPQAVFTESLPSVGAGARLTSRLRVHAGDLVVDGVCASVSAAGRWCGVSWPTVMDAVRTQAEQVLDEAPAPVEVLGIDEVRRGRPRWRQSEPTSSTPGPGEPGGPQPEAATAAEPAAVEREPAKVRSLADRWHIGFTDLSGGQGMLAQVEGRTGDDVAYWLAKQSPAWRDRIRFVAIDMCTVFVSAIRRYLPGATIVVDRFNVVKLARDAVTEVRRRITMTTRGRRGRASDPEWKIRNLLHRNKENLTPKAFTKLWNTLIDLGEAGITILKAWIAKDLLRQVLALTGTHPDRSVISHRLTRFYTWCADAQIPEIERLATTISTWWPTIEASIQTAITNAASEDYNRVVKLDAATPTATVTPKTRDYEHAAQPLAEPADASIPIKFDEPRNLAAWPTLRMTGDCHVRICEGPGVRFPWATRRLYGCTNCVGRIG